MQKTAKPIRFDTIYFHLYDRCDREKDYKIVWTEVERHFGATKHTNDTKEKSDK